MVDGVGEAHKCLHSPRTAHALGCVFTLASYSSTPIPHLAQCDVQVQMQVVALARERVVALSVQLEDEVTWSNA